MKGFIITLWVIIILLFLGIVSPYIFGDTKGDIINHTCSKMGAIKEYLKRFKIDNGTYPTTEEGLKALIENPNSKKYPNYSDLSYNEKLSLDPWKRPYIYNNYDGKNFEILSFGADGRIGGANLNKDIIYPNCMKED